LPGRKQVYRFKDENGNYAKDVIALAEENLEADPLLFQVMDKGRTTLELPSLNEIRSTIKENLSRLPEKYKKLSGPPEYPVNLSKPLEDLVANLKSKFTQTQVSDERH
jgi:nicotinate phosphoribosyltransferase